MPTQEAPLPSSSSCTPMTLLLQWQKSSMLPFSKPFVITTTTYIHTPALILIHLVYALTHFQTPCSENSVLVRGFSFTVVIVGLESFCNHYCASWVGVCREISDKNKGRQMLERMGWKTGEGLGKDGGGITEPVNTHTHTKPVSLSEYERWMCRNILWIKWSNFNNINKTPS